MLPYRSEFAFFLTACSSGHFSPETATSFILSKYTFYLPLYFAQKKSLVVFVSKIIYIHTVYLYLYFFRNYTYSRTRTE